MAGGRSDAEMVLLNALAKVPVLAPVLVRLALQGSDEDWPRVLQLYYWELKCPQRREVVAARAVAMESLDFLLSLVKNPRELMPSVAGEHQQYQQSLPESSMSQRLSLQVPTPRGRVSVLWPMIDPWQDFA